MPSEGPLFRCASENLRVTQPASQDNARSQSCACSLRFRLQSQCGIVMLPLVLQIGHERNKPWILSQVVQVSVTLEKWIAREAFIGSYLQPFECWVWAIHERVCRFWPTPLLHGFHRLGSTKKISRLQANTEFLKA